MDGVSSTKRIWREAGSESGKVTLIFRHMRFSTSKIFKWRFPVRSILGSSKVERNGWHMYSG